MKPLHQSRATPDVLLDVARKLKQPIKPELPWQTFDKTPQSTMGEESWATATKQGWVELKRAEGKGPRAEGTPARAAAAGAPVTSPPREVFDGDGSVSVHSSLHASQAFVDSSLAHRLQEMPGRSAAMWARG